VVVFKWTHQTHTHHDPGIQCQTISYAHSLSFDKDDK
jgi:hypothetical protein